MAAAVPNDIKSSKWMTEPITSIEELKKVSGVSK